MLTTRVSTRQAQPRPVPRNQPPRLAIPEQPPQPLNRVVPPQPQSNQGRRPASNSQAVVAWPLNQSLASREGSNPNSTAGVHDSGTRGTRFRGFRPRQHRRDGGRGGGGSPPDSSDDSSEDSSDDEAAAYPNARKRYNRHARRVELKPNCFNGKNWSSYKLHFLSCVESNERNLQSRY